MATFREKFNKKFGFPKEASHSIPAIAKLTGFKLSGLEKIKKKGEGAFFSNRKSVRPNITSASAWGIARVYSAVMGGNAKKFDKDLLIKN